MIDFLLEIGFEEFPPSILKQTALDVSNKVENLLKEKQIFYRSIRTIYTPRRLGAIVLGLTRKQKAQIIEIQGPPKKIAYDKNGKPTKMLRGFMNANNLKRPQIFVTRIKKGEYIYGKKEIAGASTEDILYEEIPKILKSLEFPKTMVWDKHRVRFPRPIRWLITLLDRKPLRFEFAGVKADRYSWPNPHFSFRPIRLEKPREYMNFLRHGGVVVDPNERRKIILKRIKLIAGKLKGTPVYDDNLIEAINCTTEYPEVVHGEFDKRYLELPEELLMTVLKSHGNLIWLRNTNNFICVFSAKKKALPNVQKGYTRVIASRLYDALFYYKNDMAQGLESMIEQTKGMLWLKNLGTIHDKTERLSRIVEEFKSADGIDLKALQQAARLCKADLFSQMVRDMEFTSLQGIMGSYYAKANGENKTVVMVIKEHYLPRYVGDALPSTKEGAVLSICDKVDNVLGAFLSGNRPSGSYDPLGIRRAGYGILNVLDANNIRRPLYPLIEKHLNSFEKYLSENTPKVDVNQISEFFDERMRRYLEDKGFRYDEVNAVLATQKDDITDARMRCEALKKFRGKPEFTKLVIGQKRVRNILKGIGKISKIDKELLKEKAEKTLYRKGIETTSKLEELFKTYNYLEILNILLAMRPAIDKFFDDVLVMCKEEHLRKNRLALINFINELFLQYADFSQIVIEGEKPQE